LNIIQSYSHSSLPLFVLELLGAPFLSLRYSSEHPHPVTLAFQKLGQQRVWRVQLLTSWSQALSVNSSENPWYSIRAFDLTQVLNIRCKFPTDYQEFDLWGEGTKNEMVILVITLIYHLNCIHPSAFYFYMVNEKKLNHYICLACKWRSW